MLYSKQPERKQKLSQFMGNRIFLQERNSLLILFCVLFFRRFREESAESNQTKRSQCLSPPKFRFRTFNISIELLRNATQPTEDACQYVCECVSAFVTQNGNFSISVCLLLLSFYREQCFLLFISTFFFFFTKQRYISVFLVFFMCRFRQFSPSARLRRSKNESKRKRVQFQYRLKNQCVFFNKLF